MVICFFTQDGDSSLHLAVKKKCSVLVTALASRVELNTALVNCRGETAFLMAIRSGYLSQDAIRALATHNSAMSALLCKDVQGQSAWAEMMMHQKDRYLPIIDEFLSLPNTNVDMLAEQLDCEGKVVFAASNPACKDLFAKHTFLLGRFEIRGRVILHQSVTCVVIAALDHSAGESDESGQQKNDDMKPVALKFMREKCQFQNELDSRGRDNCQLHPDFVVGVIDSYDGIENEEVGRPFRKHWRL